MVGTAIEVAKEAVKLFIRSLPEGSKFNVVSFGSEFEVMFEYPAEYTSKNISNSLQQLESFEADMGGTEIYSPLKFIFER